jgi:hypothetical protein
MAAENNGKIIRLSRFVWYEVYLHSRRTGAARECIYSGNDFMAAETAAEVYNCIHLPDYKYGKCREDYADGVTDGSVAEFYYITDVRCVHGCGSSIENGPSMELNLKYRPA